MDTSAKSKATGRTVSVKTTTVAAPTVVSAASVAVTGSISGTVTEDPSGVPLAGVLVTAYQVDGDVKNSATTDVAGHYTIPGLPDATYAVEFDDYVSGHISEMYDGYLLGDRYDPTPVTVSGGVSMKSIDAGLALGGAITGRVTDAEGNPLQGVCVDAWDSGGWAGGCTGADGMYRTTGLPAGDATLQFYDEAGPFLSQYYNNADSWDTATAVPVTVGGTVGGINATLTRGATITGTVTDVTTGAPLDGVCVTAQIDTANAYAYGCTDAQGRYETTGLPSGPAKVSFYDSTRRGYLTTYYNQAATYSQATVVPVTVGDPTTGIDVQMRLGGSVSGRVTDGSGSGIQTCVSAYVPGQTYSYTGGCSDATGAYRIVGLTSGTYQIEFSNAGDYAGLWYHDQANQATAAAVSVTVGQDTPGIDQTLPVGASISGVVTEQGTGAPVVTSVDLRDPADLLVASTQSGPDGSYAFHGVSAGSYLVVFPGGGKYVTAYFDGKATSSAADVITLTSGQNFTANQVLSINGSISGRITDRTTGAAVSGSVTAYDSRGYYVSSISAAADGTYTLWVGTGDYRLTFNGTDHIQAWYHDKSSMAAADPVHVVLGQATTGIDQALGSGGLIQLAVTGNGTAVSGAYASAYDASGTSLTTSYADQSGRITFRLPAGDYRFMVTATGWVTQYYDNAATLATATPISAVDGTLTAVDVHLAPQGSISGHITDSAGTALKGCVSIYSASDMTSRVASSCSDSLGAYSVQVPNGQYIVQFTDASSTPTHSWLYFGGSITAATAAIVRVVDGVDTPRVDGNLPLGGFLTGTLTAPSNISTTMARIQSDAGASIYVTADSQTGIWRSPPLPSGTYTVQFTGWYLSREIFQSYATPIVLVAPQTVDHIDGTLGVPVPSVAGVVKDQDGNVVTNGCVVAKAPSWYSSACLMSDGSYSFTDLPAGAYSLYLNATGYLAQWWDGIATESAATPLTVVAGSTATANFTLSRGGSISGRITDAVSGAAVATGAYVYVNDAVTGNQVKSGYAGSNGEYVVSGLPDGTYKVQFGVWKYLAEWWNNQPTSDTATTVTIVNGSTVSNVDASLAQAGSVSGRVTDVATGAPLGSIDVYVYGDTGGWMWYQNARTNSDGTYVVTGLLTGQYTVSFTNRSGRYVGAWYNGATTQASATKISVIVGQTTSGIDAALTLGGTVSGTVKDSSGAPVAGACVSVYDASNAAVGAPACTAVDGTYATAAVPAGQYKVSFTRSDGRVIYYDNKADLASADSVTVSQGKDTGGIDAAFPPDVIAGTVLDSVTNLPIAGACVYLYNPDATYAGMGQCVGNEGSFSFAAAPSGTYQVVVADPAGTHATKWGPTASMPGGTAGLVVKLDPITTIAGHVTEATSGKALQGVCAYLYPVGSDTSAAASCTLADGRIVMQGVPAGSYQLAYADTTGLHTTTWYGGSSDRASSTTVTVTDGSIKLDADVAMPAITTVMGVIKDGSGSLLTGVCAYLYPIGSDTSAAASCTVADGRIVMQDVPAGTYQLAVSDPAGLHETTWFGNSGQRSGATILTVASGTVSQTDITMPAIKTVVALVKDAATGTPLAGACGYLYPVGSDTSAVGSCAGSDGRLVFQPVPAGSYQLAVVDPTGVRATMWTGGVFDRAAAGTIDLTAADSSTDAVFSMQAVGSISGRVVDGSGTPLADVCVYADFLDGSYAGLATCTGADGTYSFAGVSPTGYKLAFYPPGEPTPSHFWWGGATTEADATVVTVPTGGIAALGDMAIVQTGGGSALRVAPASSAASSASPQVTGSSVSASPAPTSGESAGATTALPSAVVTGSTPSTSPTPVVSPPPGPGTETSPAAMASASATQTP
jgi:protocatechuate 3,4-dioxygenase beta subunit